MKKSEFQQIIIEFFASTENPTDEQIHALAEDNKVNTHTFERNIYEILSSFLYNGRYNEETRDGKEIEIDEQELSNGIEIEMEHTDNKLVAKRIALDHLAEFPDYYARLAKMEDEAKQKNEMTLMVRRVFGKVGE